jgi:hypothetical protein
VVKVHGAKNRLKWVNEQEFWKLRNLDNWKTGSLEA